MEVGENAVGAMQAYLRLKRYILPSGIAREALQAAAPFLSALEPSAARSRALEEVCILIDEFERDFDQKWRDQIKAAIRALSSPDHADAGKVEGDGWLPIESAPKDGTHILVYCSRMKEVGEARWHSESFGGRGPTWVIAGFNQAWASEPTHWRPLPLPPFKGGQND